MNGLTHWIAVRVFDFAFEDIASRVKIPQRLRHLFAFDEQEPSVDPKFRERVLAAASAALCDFAFVVREDQVFAAGVDVDYVTAEKL